MNFYSPSNSYMSAKKKSSSSPKSSKPAPKATSVKAKATSPSTKASVPSKTGNKKVAAPAKPDPVKKPPVASKAKAAKKATTKAKASLSAKGKTSKPKNSSSSAKNQKNLSAVAKLKDIVSRAKSQETGEEGKDSAGFSMSDVREILSKRKKTTAVKTATKDTAKAPFKASPKKRVETVSKVKKLSSASIDDILGFGAPVAGTKVIRRDESKISKQWLPYYNSLKAMRDSLKGSIGERSSETIGSSARESGELSLNSSDAGTETFDRDLALSMVANDHEALEEIEDAIDRIFNGSYGICQQTNKPINKNRLRAVPFTRFSVEGQNLFERSNRKDRELGTGVFATISDSTMGEED